MRYLYDGIHYMSSSCVTVLIHDDGWGRDPSTKNTVGIEIT